MVNEWKDFCGKTLIYIWKKFRGKKSMFEQNEHFKQVFLNSK